MKSNVASRVACLCVAFAAFTHNASAQEKRVPHSQLTVTPARNYLPEGAPSEAFTTHVQAACGKGGGAAPLAPILAALGGIVVDWVMGSLMDNANKRVQEMLKLYTTSYASRPLYRDILDSAWWSDDQFPVSCIVAQRIDCTISEKEAEEDNAACAAGTGKAGISAAFLLRDEGVAWRVLPLALEARTLKVKHSKGTISVAASLQLKAFWVRDGAGFAWDTGEVVVMAEKFNGTGGKSGRTTVDKGLKLYPVPATDQQWERANGFVIPAPPRHQAAAASPSTSPPRATAFGAYIVRFAEVGEPPRTLKAVAAFLGAHKDDVSGVLSEAVKKKLKLSDE